VKREEKILLIVFAAVLLGALGAALSLGIREPSAKVQFSEASMSTNGHLILHYAIKQSPHTYLREIESIDDHETVISQMGSGTGNLFPIHTWGSHEHGVMPSVAGGASLIITTGITYTVTLSNRLILYDFTNTSGVRYRADFRMGKHT
jgi:hypothetical protein